MLGRRAFARSSRPPVSFHAPAPRPSLRSVRLLVRSSEAAVNVQTNKAPAHADLVTEAGKLAELKKSGADKEAIEQQIELLTQLSAAAGADKIVPELNNGTFQGYTLTGQTAQRFSSVITLGILSFNKYQPNDMKIVMSKSNEAGGVYKGPHSGVEQAYIVTAPFEFVEQTEGGEPVPTGLKGRHLAIAEYNTVADNSQRLAIQFKRVQLEPADDSPEHLQRWLDTLLPHNPEMDPKTGVLNVGMDQHPPAAYLDHVMMIPEYQLLKGNFGSVTLLQRLN